MPFVLSGKSFVDPDFRKIIDGFKAQSRPFIGEGWAFEKAPEYPRLLVDCA